MGRGREKREEDGRQDGSQQWGNTTKAVNSSFKEL